MKLKIDKSIPLKKTSCMTCLFFALLFTNKVSIPFIILKVVKNRKPI